MFVDKSVQARRLKICDGCDGSRWTYGAGLTCGLFMQPTKGEKPTCGCKLTWKTKIEGQRCPRGKW